MSTRTQATQVSVRLATHEDEELANLLAQLDSAAPLRGPKLLAFVDGWPAAALSLEDGRVVANPFTPTAHPVAMLRLRASQLATPIRERRPLSLRRRRLRPA
jgi:hypothetical protein